MRNIESDSTSEMSLFERAKDLSRRGFLPEIDTENPPSEGQIQRTMTSLLWLNGRMENGDIVIAEEWARMDDKGPRTRFRRVTLDGPGIIVHNNYLLDPREFERENNF